jgi:hypothetical protein
MQANLACANTISGSVASHTAQCATLIAPYAGCFGHVDRGILTVRFTYRGGIIRIFDAGFWRKGKAIDDREDQVHK